MHGKFFGRSDPKFVFIFHGNLARNVLALKGFVAWQPSICRLVRFFLVGWTVDSEKIKWILANCKARVRVELKGASRPSIA